MVVVAVQVRKAKSKLSALLDAAEEGRPTTITRHGRAVAVLVPVADAQRLYAGDRPSFAELLLEWPGGIELERDPAPLREAEL